MHPIQCHKYRTVLLLEYQSSHNEEETNSTKLKESDFFRDIGKSLHQRTITTGTCLVHLREKSISKVGNNSGAYPSNNTTQQRNTKIRCSR